jgi:hypothetical protein
MFMRYMGGGVGHFHSALASTNYPLENDEDPGNEDIQPEQLVSESDSDQEDELLDHDEAIEEDYDI